MKSSVYLKCLASQNYETGQVLGVYDFGSGDANVVYNLLYPTGNHYNGAKVNAGVYPLASIDTDVVNYKFNGDHSFRLGYKNNLDEWAVLMDINNGRYCETGYQKMTLFDTYQTGKGVGLYLTELHRLELIISDEYGVSGELKTFSIPDEIPQKALIYLNYVSGDNISFGHYDLASESIVGGIVDINELGFEPLMSANYMAGSNENLGVKTSPSSYDKIRGVPFSGNIYDAVLLSGSLGDDEADICFKCLFATGIEESTTKEYYPIPMITGYGYETVAEPGILGEYTGTALVLGNSNNIVFSVPTLATGDVVYADRLVPQTGASQESGVREISVLNPEYDVASIFARIQSTIDFRIPLTSGDTVVLYSYGEYNPYVNYRVDNLYADQRAGLEYQLWANGVLETINVDYFIKSDSITNFSLSDALQNDYTIQKSVITDYSGLWESGRIWMNSGSGGPKVYYPDAPQYDEDGTIIYITGIEGVTKNNPNIPNFGYDLYLNGQRLVTGVHYEVHSSGSYPFTLLPGGVNPNFIVSISGENMPNFTADVTYLMNGDVDTIYNEFSSELLFYPIENNPTISSVIATGTLNQITGVTGYSQQLWVNGIRQHLGIDYDLIKMCELNSGYDYDYGDLDFIVFNNEDDIFGLE